MTQSASPSFQMYVSAGSEERVSDALKPILASAIRNELGKRPFAGVDTPEQLAALVRRGPR